MFNRKLKQQVATLARQSRAHDKFIGALHVKVAQLECPHPAESLTFKRVRRMMTTITLTCGDEELPSRNEYLPSRGHPTTTYQKTCALCRKVTEISKEEYDSLVLKKAKREAEEATVKVKALTPAPDKK